MCTIDLQKAYHGIVSKIWPMFKIDILTAPTITGPDDPRWIDICDRYEAIEKAAPKEIKRYAGDMVLMHVAELEAMWRWKDDSNNQQTA